MPAFYAHKRFGAQVAKILPADLDTIVNNHYTAYDIGLQGPDIFFYYRPCYINRIIKIGTGLHHAPAREFFENALHVMKKTPRDSAQYAYLMGFITHFTLDSECHSFVNGYIEKTGVAHLEIEEEFEKKLLRLDQKDPLSYPYAEKIPTDRHTAHAVSCFFPTISAHKTQRALKDMVLVKRLFTAPNPAKQKLINGLMRLSRQHKLYKGLMNQKIDNPACQESNDVLLKKLYTSVPTAVKLIQSFDRSLLTGVELPERYDRNFE